MNTKIENKLLLIIDHSPKDELKKICNWENTTYHHHPENKGYGAGHNIAIRKVMEDSLFHLVMNPDIYFDEKVLPELLHYMHQHKDTALISPKIVNEKNELQYLCKLLPTPTDLFLKRFIPASLIANRMNRFQLKFSGYNSVMNVPYLSGSFMFLRMSALKKVGLFDERFFMYPEDVDLTRRLHKNYETIFYPFVQITHHHRAASYKSWKMLKIHLHNMAKYFNKWGWWHDVERKAINNRTLQSLGYNQNL